MRWACGITVDLTSVLTAISSSGAGHLFERLLRRDGVRRQRLAQEFGRRDERLASFIDIRLQGSLRQQRLEGRQLLQHAAAAVEQRHDLPSAGVNPHVGNLRVLGKKDPERLGVAAR